jgi:hypothetical protein
MNCLKLSKENYYTPFSLPCGNNIKCDVSNSKLKPFSREITKTWAVPTLSCHVSWHRSTTQKSISATPECKSNWCNVVIRTVEQSHGCRTTTTCQSLQSILCLELWAKEHNTHTHENMLYSTCRTFKHMRIHWSTKCLWECYYFQWLDSLCGLEVRVSGYRSRGLGSIPGAARFSE